MEWLEENSGDGDREEFEDKLREVKDVVEPIFSRLYEGSGVGGDDYDYDDYEGFGGHDEL